MKADRVERTSQRSSFRRRTVLLAAAALVVFLCAGYFLVEIFAGSLELPRNALWEVVHNVCVPGQLERGDPMPCLKVDVKDGVDRGFAILRDPRGGTQFLLIPTTRISGIESPIVRGKNATNYFSMAWEVRTHLNDALGRQLPRDDVGLAVNSIVSRSQDQLHIHFSCIRREIFETLHAHQKGIGNHWAPFRSELYGQHYMAMWVPGENLNPHNPFRLVAEGLPNAVPGMANRTLVVVGFTRSDGTPGFVLLADQVNVPQGDLANGEELLDHSCQIAALRNGQTTGPETIERNRMQTSHPDGEP
jgi:CDP-diacylglycerol pyrophosphatase